MLQFTENKKNQVRDNSLVINNSREYKLSDKEATQVIELIESILGNSKNQVSTPKEPKVYEHTKDAFDNFVFTCDKNLVTYTHKDGSYVFEKTVRQALNARLKKAGAVYDKDIKAWVFTKGERRDNTGATKFCEENNAIPVSAKEMNAIIDKWNSKQGK